MPPPVPAAARYSAALDADPFARVAALPGVDEGVAAARASVDALLRHRVLRRRSAEVTAEASLRSARASAALEGHDVELEVLRRRLTADAADPAPAAPAGQVGTTTVPLGTVRLYAELGSLAVAWERAPRQAIARMHTLVGRGIVPDARLGRPRDAGGLDGGLTAAGLTGPGAGAGSSVPPAAADPLGLGPAPAPMEVGARLDGLVELLVGRTTAPAIVVAAVVHGELLALRPFGSLDGVIARAAARLVLIGRGLDPKSVTATDIGHIETAVGAGPAVLVDEAPGATAAIWRPDTAYRTAAAGYVHGGVDGVRDWVLHCARAIELGARDSLAVCEAIARSSES
jgi:hypothetical protein